MPRRRRRQGVSCSRMFLTELAGILSWDQRSLGESLTWLSEVRLLGNRAEHLGEQHLVYLLWTVRRRAAARYLHPALLFLRPCCVHKSSRSRYRWTQSCQLEVRRLSRISPEATDRSSLGWSSSWPCSVLGSCRYYTSWQHMGSLVYRTSRFVIPRSPPLAIS